MPNEDSVSRKAVRFVKEYEESRGMHVIDTQGRGEFKGFDIISISSDKNDVRTIEVKGTTRKNGIPDCFETEFSRHKKLIATHMYVVNYLNPEQVSLYIIPASAFKPEHLRETIHYKISSGFKTREMPKYKVF